MTHWLYMIYNAAKLEVRRARRLAVQGDTHQSLERLRFIEQSGIIPLLREHQFPPALRVDSRLLEWELSDALAYCRRTDSDHEDTRDLLSVILSRVDTIAHFVSKNSTISPRVKQPARGVSVKGSKQRNKGKMPRLNVRVISDQPDEYTGKKGLVKTHVFTCQDMCPSGARLKDNFDYVLSDGEKEKYAGKMLDKQIELDVIELRPPPFGVRLRAAGRIHSTPLDPKK